MKTLSVSLGFYFSLVAFFSNANNSFDHLSQCLLFLLTITLITRFSIAKTQAKLIIFKIITIIFTIVVIIQFISSRYFYSYNLYCTGCKIIVTICNISITLFCDQTVLYCNEKPDAFCNKLLSPICSKVTVAFCNQVCNSISAKYETVTTIDSKKRFL